MPQILGYMKCTFLFTYCGVHIGVNMLQKSKLGTHKEEVSVKTIELESKTLTIGGRLTLVKSML